MRAHRGLSKADTLRLAVIEHYVETGQRPDGLHVTDEWIDESIKFLTKELRPTLDAWAEIADREEKSSLVALEARKVLRMWKRKRSGKPVDPEKLDAAFNALDLAVEAAKTSPQ